MSIITSKRKKILVVLCITGFWLVMNGELLRRELFLPGLPSGSMGLAASLTPDTFFKEQWMGIYYEGEKVGYSSTTVNRVRSSETPGYIILNRIFMVVNVLDNPLKVHFEGILRVDENFRMQSFRSRLKSAGHEIRLDGALEGDTLSLSVLSGNKVFRKTTKVSDDLNLSNSLTPLMYLPNLKPGVTYSVDILDPLSFATNKAKVSIAGIEPFDYEGKSVEAYVVETIYQGVTYTAWLSDGGEVLKESTPLGWTLLRESREVASDFSAEVSEFSHDIAKLVAVPSEVKIAEPEATRVMEVYITGINPALFKLDGTNQRLLDPKTGLTRIMTAHPDAGQSRTIPITDDSLAEFLKPSLLIQSDDENIRRWATRIVSDEGNSLIAAELINRWIFNNIDKKVTFSLPSAVEVLENREGDCNEHTTLFVALARSIGIPSRIAIGLVYYKGYFYYHAWPEVFVGEWMAMDPTLGQLRADATHIKLLEGELDQQAKLMQAIGKIRIDIKSLSQDPAESEKAI